MGRNNKKYSKSLSMQVHEELSSMACYNESKKEAKINGTMGGKIFSYRTFETYKERCMSFVGYIETNHPECTTLKAARKHVLEYFSYRESLNLSAWTLHNEKSAVNKLLHITKDDEDYYHPPFRNRANIKRSRYKVASDIFYSVKNNELFSRYCESSGQRRDEVKHAKRKHLMTRQQIIKEKEELEKAHMNNQQYRRWVILSEALMFDEEYFLYTKGKGGRERIHPIVGEHAREVVDYILSLKDPEEKIWKRVPEHADIHAYRAEYAKKVYEKYARPLEEIPYDAVHKGINQRYQSEVYHCRKDGRGKNLDKRAMLYASKALGHNRICVVADNYLWKL